MDREEMMRRFGSKIRKTASGLNPLIYDDQTTLENRKLDHLFDMFDQTNSYRTVCSICKEIKRRSSMFSTIDGKKNILSDDQLVWLETRIIDYWTEYIAGEMFNLLESYLFWKVPSGRVSRTLKFSIQIAAIQTEKYPVWGNEFSKLIFNRIRILPSMAGEIVAEWLHSGFNSDADVVYSLIKFSEIVLTSVSKDQYRDVEWQAAERLLNFFFIFGHLLPKESFLPIFGMVKSVHHLHRSEQIKPSRVDHNTNVRFLCRKNLAVLTEVVEQLGL